MAKYASVITSIQWLSLVEKVDQGEYEFCGRSKEYGKYVVYSMYENKVAVCSDDGITVLDALTGEIDSTSTGLLVGLTQILDDGFELTESRLALYCPNDALKFDEKEDEYAELKEANPSLSIQVHGEHSDHVAISMAYGVQIKMEVIDSYSVAAHFADHSGLDEILCSFKALLAWREGFQGLSSDWDNDPI